MSRDWWRRERPAIGWREIYHELKRLEFRGEVRRGYFVAGLAGAQFALPEAVEMLRAAGADAEDAVVAMSASDPANVYSLPLAPGTPGTHSRGRAAQAPPWLRGRGESFSPRSHGARIRVRTGAEFDDVREAAAALGSKLTRAGRDAIVDTIDGERAAGSRWAEAFVEAGFRSTGTGLRCYQKV